MCITSEELAAAKECERQEKLRRACANHLGVSSERVPSAKFNGVGIEVVVVIPFGTELDSFAREYYPAVD